ncbi:Ion channel [Ancylostoma caninum]|uniref:Ion channel n=1 Tax=Ancylostoma caninum TaxID=29170 RepID=A0A368F4C8_ANCCA|nr:Ion channel [Ancylostoma caninum]
MLEAEGRFHGSVWHKAENLDMHLMWYYSSATFYSMTLFTTIGYGSIACQTFWGRALSVVYACIGIPLMLVVLGDIGELFQRTLTKTYIYFLLKWKNFRKKELTMPRDEIFLPMWIALPLVLIYIISCTLVIHWFDHNEGNKPGIGFPEAFYFTFISLTTIGLGDVMPYNIQMEIPAHVRKRTISDIAAHDEEHIHPQQQQQTSRRRAPTLGAMGGFDLAKFRCAARRLASPGVAHSAVHDHFPSRKMHEDRRAQERAKKAKNAMSTVESDPGTEESESEAETEIADGSPSTGSSRTYLI